MASKGRPTNRREVINKPMSGSYASTRRIQIGVHSEEEGGGPRYKWEECQVPYEGRVVVELDMERAEKLAMRAVKSKGRRAKIGPLVAKFIPTK
jgi:hypothetical protein